MSCRDKITWKTRAAEILDKVRHLPSPGVKYPAIKYGSFNTMGQNSLYNYIYISTLKNLLLFDLIL